MEDAHTALRRVPIVFIYPCLPDYFIHKSCTDILSMIIRNAQFKRAAAHKQMLAAAIWSIKTQRIKSLYQFSPRNSPRHTNQAPAKTDF